MYQSLQIRLSKNCYFVGGSYHHITKQKKNPVNKKIVSIKNHLTPQTSERKHFRKSLMKKKENSRYRNKKENIKTKQVQTKRSSSPKQSSKPSVKQITKMKVKQLAKKAAPQKTSPQKTSPQKTNPQKSEGSTGIKKSYTITLTISDSSSSYSYPFLLDNNFTIANIANITSVANKLGSICKSLKENPSVKKAQATENIVDTETTINKAIEQELKKIGPEELVNDYAFRTLTCKCHNKNLSTEEWKNIAAKYAEYQVKASGKIYWATKETINWAIQSLPGTRPIHSNE